MWFASPEQVVAARDRIDPVFLDMPLRRSASLDRRLGVRLLLKDETANPIRSFKGRGACNFLAGFDGAEGIVCASAGNFGQGLAWAARDKGVPVTVFAATSATPSKLEAMRSLGATLVLEGEDFDSAKQSAMAFADRAGLFYLEDGAVAAIADGAGTLALEISEAGEDYDSILCPLGNGALAAGVGCWAKSLPSRPEMVAVAAAGAPAMARSVIEDRIVRTDRADTIADGIAVRVPIASAVAAVRQVVDDVVLVEDRTIAAAMALLRDELDLVVEPAGAAGLAALLADPGRWRGKTVAIPLCGGNV